MTIQSAVQISVLSKSLSKFRHFYRGLAWLSRQFKFYNVKLLDNPPNAIRILGSPRPVRHLRAGGGRVTREGLRFPCATTQSHKSRSVLAVNSCPILYDSLQSGLDHHPVVLCSPGNSSAPWRKISSLPKGVLPHERVGIALRCNVSCESDAFLSVLKRWAMPLACQLLTAPRRTKDRLT